MSGTGKIAALVKKLDAIATPAFRESLARKLGAEAERLYRAGFDKQADPYGAPWGRTLVRTGYLRASGEVESVSAEGFRFRVYAPYGQFHQYGTSRIPPRLVVPTSSRGLGTWGAPFNRIASQAVRELLR